MLHNNGRLVELPFWQNCVFFYSYSRTRTYFTLLLYYEYNFTDDLLYLFSTSPSPIVKAFQSAPLSLDSPHICSLAATLRCHQPKWRSLRASHIRFQFSHRRTTNTNARPHADTDNIQNTVAASLFRPPTHGQPHNTRPRTTRQQPTSPGPTHQHQPHTSRHHVPLQRAARAHPTHLGPR